MSHSKTGLKFEDLPRAMEMLLEKVENLEKEIMDLKTNFQPIVPVELMTRKETAQFFSISLVTVHQWVKQGTLISHKISNKVYFKRSEVINTMSASRD